MNDMADTGITIHPRTMSLVAKDNINPLVTVLKAEVLMMMNINAEFPNVVNTDDITVKIDQNILHVSSLSECEGIGWWKEILMAFVTNVLSWFCPFSVLCILDDKTPIHKSPAFT